MPGKFGWEPEEIELVEVPKKPRTPEPKELPEPRTPEPKELPQPREPRGDR